ncbi:hypothetical protein C7B69_15405 [filamentous cyanobacterium Phorm 46]|nr:hypothetical protein C7B69_15405 [filamentous cyanobacterium Phorm 46]
MVACLRLLQLPQGSCVECIRHPAEGRIIVGWGMYWVSIALYQNPNGGREKPGFCTAIHGLQQANQLKNPVSERSGAIVPRVDLRCFRDDRDN